MTTPVFAAARENDPSARPYLPKIAARRTGDQRRNGSYSSDRVDSRRGA